MPAVKTRTQLEKASSQKVIAEQEESIKSGKKQGSIHASGKKAKNATKKTPKKEKK